MTARLKFLPGEQKTYFSKIKVASQLSYKQIALVVGVHPRTFNDWCRGKSALPENISDIFDRLYNIKLPEEKDVLINRWKKRKLYINKLGGIAHFNKYGSPATVEGRRKGGSNALKILRQKGIVPDYKHYYLPKIYDENLAEFVGILLGDGGITSGQAVVTINSIADKDYLPYLVKLGTLLFKEPPKTNKRKNENAINISYSGIQIISYLTDIGLKIGNKVTQQVDVPDWIKKSVTFKVACVRGLMDTDGGVFLHKYKVNGHLYSYKKINFTNSSQPLLNFVFRTLVELGLSPKFGYKHKLENKRIWLYNNNEVDKYLEIVGTHNPRLLKYQGEWAGRQGTSLLNLQEQS